MLCPACREQQLHEKCSKDGLLFECCRHCKGVWLDGGELYLLSQSPKELESQLEGGLSNPQHSDRNCPRCETEMQTGSLLHPGLEVEQCPECQGLWFDEGEVKQAIRLDRRLFALPQDDPEDTGDVDERQPERLKAISRGALPLPNLFIRSASMLVLLYSMLGLILIAMVEMQRIETGVAMVVYGVILVAQYVLGPWLMDLWMTWFYQLTWTTVDELPAHLRKFVKRVCQEQNMRPPSFGIIHDGAPNAFTYGHHPGNMRIVLSQGIFDLLEPEEVEAVVAHEMGHGKHWDMALMTIAQLVPMILYFIYRTLIRHRGGKNDKSGPYRLVIAIGAYVLYIVSEYIVLWFSRCREYHADRFAGRVTGNPSALASALVKIAIGLAAGGKPETTKDNTKQKNMETIGALGIFDSGAARALVISSSIPSSQGKRAGVDIENVKRAMRWDLWNPWAKYYELHSTHPLVSNRLQYLAEQSASMGQEPYVVFDRKPPESYWDEFAVDLLVMMLPKILALCGGGGLALLLGAPALTPNEIKLVIGTALLGFGVGSLVTLQFRYRRDSFPPMTIAALLHKVKVSSVRPVPASVQGTVLGRGVPGLIWSEDIVMQDKTGILFLDYQQPLRIWTWLFGLFRNGEFAGQRITAKGWFRRAPVPYLEISSFTINGNERTCYVTIISTGVAVLITVAGFAMIALGLLY
ncbi:MAG: hypothetical protein DWH91_01540 [Planctomycetota bacterium]|nr:MAG: hypothetical protein DWH91_01540 [Planctomycetota bacterium]